uniref:Uncharacterized protein n=1 Tax=Pristionchus pacificus TaxID=54126 RepID=A0A2A6BS30_PRIPA|eukprot:PDM68710.1 hypothetical protein PRIPAC_47012 [Pristionchus pacificus]
MNKQQTECPQEHRMLPRLPALRTCMIPRVAFATSSAASACEAPAINYINYAYRGDVQFPLADNKIKLQIVNKWVLNTLALHDYFKDNASLRFANEPHLWDEEVAVSVPAAAAAAGALDGLFEVTTARLTNNLDQRIEFTLQGDNVRWLAMLGGGRPGGGKKAAGGGGWAEEEEGGAGACDTVDACTAKEY